MYDLASALAFYQILKQEVETVPPLFVGVLPLVSVRHAAFIHNEVPGISIPETIRARVEANHENSAAEGIKIAIELIEQVRTFAQGVYLMPPFNRFDYAAEIIESISQPVA
jgi:homocysteine S-methyltransferase